MGEADPIFVQVLDGYARQDGQSCPPAYLAAAQAWYEREARYDSEATAAGRWLALYRGYYGWVSAGRPFKAEADADHEARLARPRRRAGEVYPDEPEELPAGV